MPSFYEDVIKKDHRFSETGRVHDLALLEPVMRGKVEHIIRDAAAHGLTLQAFETYRSQPRQQELFNQHATQLRTVGVHHYGLACDIVKGISGHPSWKGSFDLLRDLAYHYGLIWGGDWGTPQKHHTIIDSVHVQRCSVGRQAALFRGEWYPDAKYNPYDDLKH
jgi:hypothetical protein